MPGSNDQIDYVLALETSIGGGSISLFLQGQEIDSWAGSDGVSRSEDVPEVIENLLKRNKIERRRIGLVAAAVGIGSFTGTRIGVATGLGISTALGCRLLRVPLLRAIAADIGVDSDVFAAVSINKREVGWQNFSRCGEYPTPEINSFPDFLELFSSVKPRPLRSIFDQTLFEAIRDLDPELVRKGVSGTSGNLSRYVGIYAIENNSGGAEFPLYISGVQQNRF